MIKSGKFVAVLLSCCLIFSACTAVSNKNNGIVITNSLNSKEAIVGDMLCTFSLVSDSSSMNIMTCARDGIRAQEFFMAEIRGNDGTA